MNQLESHELLKNLNLLKIQIFEVLQKMPDVTSIVMFGSLAEDNFDGYSDVDVDIITSAYENCVLIRHTILNEIGPIEVELPVEESPDRCAFSIIFSNQSYYHKLDLGFVSSTNIEMINKIRSSGRTVWEKSSIIVSPEVTNSGARSIFNSTDLLVFDQLIGAMRYVKYRKRGKVFTSWRFLTSLIDTSLRIAYEQKYNWRPLNRKLNTWEYAELDELVSKDEQYKFVERLNLSSLNDMDDYFCRLFFDVANFYRERAVILNETFPEDRIERFRQFLHRELEINLS